MTSTEHQVVRNETRAVLRKPWILSATIATVVTIIYLWNALSGASKVDDLTPAPGLRALALVPERVVHGEVYRMFTANLLYSSVWSLIASVITLLVVGTAVESRWGVRRYLASAVIACLGATVPVLLFEPTVSRWATGNGAVMALIGAALVVATRAGYNRLAISLVAVLDVVVYVWFTPESTIWAPLGGVATGAIIAILLIAAPDDRRRDRVQAILLGSFFVLLCAIVALHVISR
ncbi:rhomboid family intramembrane serine protease [Cumulibacter manganitolerans]|uniref:rhomboid family intramembrane serine protease n=1 Tax=Cumulibacter manganitolerans TaxID=1884992 RepID=UPI001296A6F3|nr:rhomboid family intramembrane serine protease [Cumulibacter manganitolerans]